MNVFLTSILLLIFSLPSHAELRTYLEPKLGLGSAGVAYDVGNENGTKTGVSNFNLGAVWGAVRDDFYFGLDTRYDNLGGAYSQGGSTKSLNYLSIGLGIGYTLTYVPLRWTMSLDIQQRGWSDNFEGSFESGGWRFGLGYYLSEKFIINFDYSEPFYRNANGEKYLPRIYSFGISFPMEYASEKVPWKEKRGYKKESIEDDFGASDAAAATSGLTPLPSASDSIDAVSGSSDDFNLDEEPQTSFNTTPADNMNSSSEFDLAPAESTPSNESTGDPLEDELDF
ncbi:MAG: hypothetical protein ACLGGX_02400 [Bdellovibrionia bacterium]